jgi:hypothetical protein
MSVYLGSCRTLIVESDDKIAEQFANSLRRFPNATTVRSKSAREALLILQGDVDGPDEIHQVCIDGRVWTVPQAMPILQRRTLISSRAERMMPWR